MNIRPFVAISCFITAVAFAADSPAIPGAPIAKKKGLLFSDDFERAELGKSWGQVVPTFTLENGTMKGTQMRWDAPATDGKPAVEGHQAVIGTDIPTKDSVIEFRFRFAGATAVSANSTTVSSPVPTMDGKPVAFLKSSGIAHPTKSKVEFGCMGNDGFFDNIKIWSAESVKP